MLILFYAIMFGFALRELAQAQRAPAALAPAAAPYGWLAERDWRAHDEAGAAAAAGARLYEASRRAGDVALALAALSLLLPALLLIALLVALDSPGPVLHRRRVLGRRVEADGAAPAAFDAFKFRSMVPNADDLLAADPDLRAAYEREYKLKDDPRVTRLGRVLRRWSLDELPQLVNVLRGEMAVVGPRIVSPPELARYGEHGDRLLSVRPGLTGLWQVSGRHLLTYEERVRLDLWYIEHRSPALDLAILWRTVRCVLARTGAF